METKTSKVSLLAIFTAGVAVLLSTVMLATIMIPAVLQPVALDPLEEISSQAIKPTQFREIYVAHTAMVGGQLTALSNVSVAGTLSADSYEIGSDRYAVGAGSDGLALYCASETVTGTHVITTSTHGMTDVAAVVTALAGAPGAAAGNPFLAHAIYSGTTITLTVVQDDATAATDPATVDFCVIGE